MRQPIRICMTTCRRCGRPLATASRSLTGADAAKAELDRICRACVTPAEEAGHDDPYEAHCAAIVRDQTDWRSPRCKEKRAFCRDHGIPCI